MAVILKTALPWAFYIQSREERVLLRSRTDSPCCRHFLGKISASAPSACARVCLRERESGRECLCSASVPVSVSVSVSAPAPVSVGVCVCLCVCTCTLVGSGCRMNQQCSLTLSSVSTIASTYGMPARTWRKGHARAHAHARARSLDAHAHGEQEGAGRDREMGGKRESHLALRGGGARAGSLQSPATPLALPGGRASHSAPGGGARRVNTPLQRRWP